MGTAQSSLERLICPSGKKKEDNPYSGGGGTVSSSGSGAGSNRSTTPPLHRDPHEDLTANAPIPEILGLPLGHEDRCLANQHPELMRRLGREVSFCEASLQTKDSRRKKSSTVDGKQEWRILYSTTFQGRSFPQLVRRITNAGPTLVLIKQPKTEKGEGLIIGGLSFTQWRTVSERCGQEQMNSSGSKSAAKQDPRFFGDEDCFTFRHDPVAAGRTCRNAPSATTILKGRSNINRNFMYFFDEHPTDEERVGFGMGGQVGYHAWYIDSMLEKCQCKSRRCTTFVDEHSENGAPEALHPTEEVFPVATLEVYALDSTMLPPELRRELERKALVKRYANDLAGVDPSVAEGEEGKEISIAQRFSGADKAMLELAGAHHFYSDDIRPDECPCKPPGA